MHKLTALVRHILHVTGLPPEQVRAFADQGDLYPIGRDRGPLRSDEGDDARRQIELGLFRYDGVIQIERYPGEGSDFAALVASWLMEHDGDREGLADPSLDIELNVRGGDADLEVAVEFQERLEAVEDANGNIPYGGKMWRVSPNGITAVEELAAIKAVNTGAGKKP